MKDLSGKVAVITGSSSGVGAATARLLASQGCHVVINYNSSADAAQQVAAECEQHGVEVLVCAGNVATDADCQKLVDATVAKWGRLDVLINNAGTTKFVDHWDLDGLNSDDFQHIYGVNVIGCYQMIRAANRVMQKQDEGGVVVNVASPASSRTPMPADPGEGRSSPAASATRPSPRGCPVFRRPGPRWAHG